MRRQCHSPLAKPEDGKRKVSMLARSIGASGLIPLRPSAPFPSLFWIECFATEAAHERVGVAVLREAVVVVQVPAVHD